MHSRCPIEKRYRLQQATEHSFREVGAITPRAYTLRIAFYDTQPEYGMRFAWCPWYENVHNPATAVGSYQAYCGLHTGYVDNTHSEVW